MKEKRNYALSRQSLEARKTDCRLYIIIFLIFSFRNKHLKYAKCSDTIFKNSKKAKIKTQSFEEEMIYGSDAVSVHYNISGE